MSEQLALTIAEVKQAALEALGMAKKSPAPVVPDEGVYKCANGHKWDSLEDAAKCCTGVWRPALTPTGLTNAAGEQLYRQTLVADYGSMWPLGDELIEAAKKRNQHSLGDELFRKVK